MVQFDLNYPRSVSKIDHEFLFKGLEDYMQWLETDGRWRFFYRYGEKGPVRFRMHGDGLGVKYVYDDSEDAEFYSRESFEKEISNKIPEVMNIIRPLKTTIH